MALNLNFYHEIHKEEYARARDPLKLASMAGVGIVILMAGFYFYRLNEASSFTKEASRLRADWAKLEPHKLQAEKREKELLDGQVTNKALVERVQGRFYWAPVLSHILKATSTDVQLLTLSAEYHAAASSEVVLAGLAAGVQPRSVAETFRLRLQEALSVGFEGVSVRYDGTNSLEETLESVEIEGEAYNMAKFRLRVALGKAKEPNKGATEGEKEIVVTAPLAANVPATPTSGIGKTMAQVRGTLDTAAGQSHVADAEINTGAAISRPTPLNAAQVAKKGGRKE